MQLYLTHRRDFQLLEYSDIPWLLTTSKLELLIWTTKIGANWLQRWRDKIDSDTNRNRQECADSNLWSRSSFLRNKKETDRVEELQLWIPYGGYVDTQSEVSRHQLLRKNCWTIRKFVRYHSHLANRSTPEWSPGRDTREAAWSPPFVSLRQKKILNHNIISSSTQAVYSRSRYGLSAATPPSLTQIPNFVQ